ncbi:hypothetical protein E1091_00225 [Micromonospora fluostatini]|uniref:Uncharacterized protein n=1 Tax=Micromonospora fluostatini TaxID=1629071 RepID=A0ABY2DM78_9ACTN|nr:hypothetical protein E1091_00225 [Micromonospora fluostatini]
MKQATVGDSVFVPGDGLPDGEPKVGEVVEHTPGHTVVVEFPNGALTEIPEGGVTLAVNTIDLLGIARPSELHWFTWGGDGDGPAAGTFVDRGPSGYLPDAPFEAGYPETLAAVCAETGRRWLAVAYVYTDESMDFDDVREEMDSFEAAADGLLLAHGQHLNAFMHSSPREATEAVVIELGIEVPNDVFEALADALRSIPENA